jgi:preprotein translocase subunit SecD
MKHRPVLAVGLVLWSLLIGAGLQGCLSGEEPPSKPVRFELRLADASMFPGAVQATVEGSGETVYLSPEVVLTNAHVRRSGVQKTYSGDYGVELTLTEEGGEKLARLTRENLYKRVAILLDGRLVMAPRIQTEIPGGVALIEGDFTKEKAGEIARGIQAGQ